MTSTILGHLLSAGPSGADVPVVPDAETARRWLTEELADPAYHQGDSLLDRFLGWLGSLFTLPEGLSGPLIPAPVALAVIVGLVVLIAIVTLLVIGPVRRSRRTSSGAVLDVEDSRSAAELRAAAERAERTQDWDAAVLDRFRAVARSLEERVVLDERPGRTAHEVALDAAPALPALGAELMRASDLFDGVCYGGRRAQAADAAAVRHLDEAVMATKLRRHAVTTDDAELPDSGDGPEPAALAPLAPAGHP